MNIFIDVERHVPENSTEKASPTKIKNANPLEEASLTKIKNAIYYSSYEDETFLHMICLFYELYQMHRTTKKIPVSRYKNQGGEYPMQLYSSILYF